MSSLGSFITSSEGAGTGLMRTLAGWAAPVRGSVSGGWESWLQHWPRSEPWTLILCRVRRLQRECCVYLK